MGGSDTDPAALSADPASSTRRWVMVSLCAAAAIAYIQRNCIGVAESTIRAELGMSKTQMGWALGGFYATYAFFQIPTGSLGERIGARGSLSLYSAIWSVATALTALAGFGLVATLVLPLIRQFQPDSDSFSPAILAAIWWLYIVRLLGGIGQAGLFPCSAIVISQWFPQSERGSVSGWIGSFQQVGGIIAAGLTGLLLLQIGWRALFVIFSLPGIAWAILFYFWFRDRPSQHAAVNEAELQLIGGQAVKSNVSDDPPGGTPWIALLCSPPMWFICGQQFCRGAGYIFYASWFPTFLQETRDVTVAKSGLLTMIPLVGSGIGSALAGKISDRLLISTGDIAVARRFMAVAGMLGCAGLIFAAYFISDPNVVVVVISGGAFCAALAGPSGYATTIDMGGRHVATIFATMNMAGNAGAMLFPIAVPLLQALPGGWNLVLFVFGGVYIFAAGFWMLLNPTGKFTDHSWIDR